MVAGARRIGALGLLVAAAVLVLTPAAGRAEELRALELERFKVKPGGGRASTVEAGAIVLRQYSTVRCEGVGLEAAEVRVQAEWLNPLSYVDIGVRLHLVYDDEVAESVEGAIPKGSRHNELVYRPKWAAGRRIQALELSHGATGVEIQVAAVKVAVRHTAVTMASSVLAGARLDADGNLANDILIARWNAPREKLPSLAGVNTPVLRLVASVSGAAAWVMEKGTDVRLLAVGADGNVLKSFPIRVDGNVRSIAVPLKEVDLTTVARLVFQGGGTGVNLAVRQITIGAGTSGLTLKEVNERFQALLEESRKGKSIPESALAQLAGLLDLYRALE